MTNIDAFMKFWPDSDIGNVSLQRYGIDPTLSDQISASMALGMIEKSISPDYKQGNTSETLKDSSRQYMLDRAIKMLEESGFEYKDLSSGDNVIIGTHW